MNNDVFQWIVVIELAIIALLLLLPHVRRPVV